MSHFFRMARTGLTLLRKPLIVRTRPLHFQIEPVVGCNLKCQMCQVPGYPRDRLAQMPLEHFQRIFDKVLPLKIGLSGAGEPFMNPDLLAMARHARARGASVLTTTNFTLCSGKQEEIVRSGLNLIKISLDSIAAETYRKIRGLDRFDQIVRDLGELQAVKKRLNSPTPYVRLQFILQADNLGEIEGMIGLARAAGANSVYFQPLDTLLIPERKEGLTRGVEIGLLRERLGAARRKAQESGISSNARILLGSLDSYYRKYEPGIPSTPPARVCLLPWFSMYIAVNGDVRPCCSFVEPGTVTLGNLLTQSLEDVWNGEGYRQLRRDSRNRRLAYGVCRNCVPNRLRDFVRLAGVLPGFAQDPTE